MRFLITWCLVLGAVLVPGSSSRAEIKQKKINWILSHEPNRVFERAAKEFKSQVETLSGGSMVVEVKTAQEFFGAPLEHQEVFKRLAAGEFQMTQAYSNYLGVHSKDLWVFDVPYLFTSHKHVSKVVEGRVGKKLLADFYEANQKVTRGLAFSYSGGYRVIPSNKPIQELRDFEGLNVITSRSPYASKIFFETLGGKVSPLSHEDAAQSVAAGKITSTENTFSRYEGIWKNTRPKYINETNHSVFLTLVMVNEKFFKGLTEREKDILSKAAVSAAAIEREDALKDNESEKTAAIKSGIQVVALSEEVKNEIAKKLVPAYKEYSKFFSKGLIQEIQSLGK